MAATRAEVINWAMSLANAHRGVDADGAYGMQCVDLPNQIAIQFFGRRLPGNGIDMAAAGRNNGWEYYTSGLPAAGAIWSGDTGNPWGHTGLTISDPDSSGQFRTIEQNVGTGGGGGPAVYQQRRLSNPGLRIFAWTYPPYKDGHNTAFGGGGEMSVGATLPPISETMDFCFNIKDDPAWNQKYAAGALYFYNGAINEVQGVHNTEERNYLYSIYKDTTGRSMKEYFWSSKAPVYIRFFGVVRPGSQNEDILNLLKQIYKNIDEAT